MSKHTLYIFGGCEKMCLFVLYCSNKLEVNVQKSVINSPFYFAKNMFFFKQICKLPVSQMCLRPILWIEGIVLCVYMSVWVCIKMLGVLCCTFPHAANSTLCPHPTKLQNKLLDSFRRISQHSARKPNDFQRMHTTS